MLTNTSHSWQSDFALERPPGALPLAQLAEKCTSCGDCVAVCPAYSLLLDGAGLPYFVDKNACTECGLCADICVHGGILLTEATARGLKLQKGKTAELEVVCS